MKRRDLLTVGATSLVGLGGCTGLTGTKTNQQTRASDYNKSSRSTGGAQQIPDEIPVVSSRPECGDTDADMILEVSPEGAYYAVAGKSAAENASQDISRILNLSSESRVEIKEEGTNENSNYTVEVVHEPTGLNQLREFARNASYIQDFGYGRTPSTIVELVPEIKSQIREQSSPEKVDISIYRPTSPNPLSIFVFLHGVDQSSLQSSLPGFEWRVETESGMKTVLTSEEVTEISGVTKLSTGDWGIPIKISGDYREEFTNQLERAGALSHPKQYPIQIFFQGEKINSVTISPNFGDSLREGEGEIRTMVYPKTEDQGKQIVKAATPDFSFSFPKTMTLEECSTK